MTLRYLIFNQYEFDMAANRSFGRREIFCKVSHENSNGPVTSHYRKVTENELLQHDNYYIDFWDYRIGICFVDRKCDPDEKKDFFTKSIESFTGVL